MEILYQERWTPMDGLGALIITPTRELAYQIYNVLQVVGKHHSFSAALLIGTNLRTNHTHLNNHSRFLFVFETIG